MASPDAPERREATSDRALSSLPAPGPSLCVRTLFRHFETYAVHKDRINSVLLKPKALQRLVNLSQGGQSEWYLHQAPNGFECFVLRRAWARLGLELSAEFNAWSRRM